ncbi:MAG: hypothetical protein QOE58_922 [Actinomycetota bacterium]|jgi:transcriptional regulator with XRE-family HTH domain|nr:hypothetical protein [Actinomycetota bacterium]
MSAVDSHPWVARRRLAVKLRRLRQSAGKTIEAAAAELIVSEAKISRIETSGKGCSERDVRDLCRYYGASDELRTELMHEAAQTKRRGWWHEFGPLDETVAIFVDFERIASAIRVYDSSLIPGLLQTAEFAHAMLPCLRPPGELKPDWVARAVRLRIARQEIIRESEIKLFAIIDEAALRRSIKSRPIMLRQVEHLISEAQRDNVDLQVVPFGAGYHAGLESSFQHLALPTESELLAGVVHIESQYGSFVLDKQLEVSLYVSIFEDISTRIALSPDETIEWLQEFYGQCSAPESEGESVVTA